MSFQSMRIALATLLALAGHGVWAQANIPTSNPLQGAIEAEAAARIAADTNLSQAITNEASARALGDAALLGAINAETEARKAAIEALQGQPTGATRCYDAHTVRVNGDEIQFSVIFVQNADLQNPATIQRITVRDDHGAVLHDSGPRSATAMPHPPATAAVPPEDITIVRPGGTVGLGTTDIWGFNLIPQFMNRGTRPISITAEVTKAGDPKLITVHSRQIVRQRIFAPNLTLGIERSNTDSTCFQVPVQ